MLLNKNLLQIITNNKGLSLIEAMVAMVILSVGFLGVYSLTVLSEQSLYDSVKRQKMQLQANQILDVIASDKENIDQYAMNLTTCTAPSTSNNWEVRGYEWCQRLQDEVGNAGTSNNRSITISTLADNSKVVHILLEARNGAVQVVMKRSFND